MKKIIGIAAVILLLGAIVVFTQKEKKETPMNMGDTNSSASKDTENANDSTAEAVDKVAISNFAFSPAKITVKKGTKVTWTNKDTVAHTVTANTMPGPDSELLEEGGTYSYTFDTAGTFSYFCKPHTYMKGTVVVTE